jgi:hypothetical protein
MLDEVSFDDLIVNLPAASVVAWPNVMGSPAVASNKVTLTFASGSASEVPPVWTTPLNAAAPAEETNHAVIETTAITTSTWSVRNEDVRIKMVLFAFNTDARTILTSNRLFMLFSPAIEIRLDRKHNARFRIKRTKRVDMLRMLTSANGAPSMQKRLRFDSGEVKMDTSIMVPLHSDNLGTAKS